jgi:hypothetical protein
VTVSASNGKNYELVVYRDAIEDLPSIFEPPRSWARYLPGPVEVKTKCGLPVTMDGTVKGTIHALDGNHEFWVK